MIWVTCTCVSDPDILSKLPPTICSMNFMEAGRTKGGFQGFQETPLIKFNESWLQWRMFHSTRSRYSNRAVTQCFQ